MRLIDADELKKAIMLKDNANEETWEQLYDSVLDEIDNAPTVEERPTGKWIYHKADGYFLPKMECSVCGAIDCGDRGE